MYVAAAVGVNFTFRISPVSHVNGAEFGISRSLQDCSFCFKRNNGLFAISWSKALYWKTTIRKVNNSISDNLSQSHALADRPKFTVTCLWVPLHVRWRYSVTFLVIFFFPESQIEISVLSEIRDINIIYLSCLRLCRNVFLVTIRYILIILWIFNFFFLMKLIRRP